jgi:hypothetical protein
MYSEPQNCIYILQKFISQTQLKYTTHFTIILLHTKLPINMQGPHDKRISASLVIYYREEILAQFSCTPRVEILFISKLFTYYMSKQVYLLSPCHICKELNKITFQMFYGQ